MKAKFIIVLLITTFRWIEEPKITSKEIIINNGAIELSGTLSYTSKDSPLVIWIHGSGNIDRNGNQGTIIKANYIQQFRERINQHQIAFFSYDKRTANKKNVPHLKATLFDDLVEDAKIVVQHLKENYTFKSIIIAGHSQGSLTGMLASENAQKYISIAGPSQSIDQVIIGQISKQNEEFGNVAAAHFKELKETGTIQQINPLLSNVFAKQNQSFLKNWMSYSPLEEIKKMTIPCLLINGTKDLQVSTKAATELQGAIPSAQLKLIENMNHVLKHIEKDADNLNSYYSAEYPISNQLIASIIAFIKQ